MKFLYLNGDVDPSMITKLLDFIDNSAENQMTIYFRSGGGETDCAIFITDILNAYKDSIKLVAGEYLYSCAVDIFYDFLGNKEFNRAGTLLLLHRTSFTTRSTSKNWLLLEEYSKQEDIGVLNRYKDFMTTKDIEDFHNGEDIFYKAKDVEKYFIK